jgi:hypothetical protein
VLKADKSHDNIVIKAKTRKDTNGMSAGKMSALRKRPGKEERNSQEWQTTLFV